MPQQQQRCVYCNEPATLLCDFTIGQPVFSRGDDGKPRPFHTCDLPMCAKHREQRGSMHVRFSTSVNGRRGMFDTIDHCLEHAGQREAIPTPRITDAAAARLRREIQVAAHRRAVDQLGLQPSALPATAEQGELF
jgi:hypothetical protein